MHRIHIGILTRFTAKIKILLLKKKPQGSIIIKGVKKPVYQPDYLRMGEMPEPLIIIYYIAVLAVWASSFGVSLVIYIKNKTLSNRIYLDYSLSLNLIIPASFLVLYSTRFTPVSVYTPYFVTLKNAVTCIALMNAFRFVYHATGNPRSRLRTAYYIMSFLPLFLDILAMVLTAGRPDRRYILEPLIGLVFAGLVTAVNVLDLKRSSMIESTDTRKAAVISGIVALSFMPVWFLERLLFLREQWISTPGSVIFYILIVDLVALFYGMKMDLNRPEDRERQIMNGISRLSGDAGLTEREKELAAYAVQGFSDQETADALKLSLKTVRNHLQNIYRKTGVNSRLELTRELNGKTQKN